MAKGKQGATSAGDASSNPTMDDATAAVAALTEPMAAGSEERQNQPAPKKVRGLEPVPSNEQVLESIRNPRMEAMERIARGRAEQFAEENGIDPTALMADDDVDPADAEADEARKELGKGGAPEAKNEPEPSQTAKQLEGDLIDDPTRFKVKLKVDGEEVVVSLADALRNVQKDQAANKRLEEATRLLNEARAQAQQPAPSPAPAAPTTAPAPQANVKEKIQEFVAATYSGDEERLAKATAELLGGAQPAVAAPATPAFDEGTLSRVVQQELHKTQVAGALEKFRSDNSEIVKDPHLALVADQFLANELQGATLASLPIDQVREVLNSAAKQTLDWAAKLGMQIGPKTDPTTTRRDRAARKTEIDELPSINASATGATEKVPTASETINEMRKARGLPAI